MRIALVFLFVLAVPLAAQEQDGPRLGFEGQTLEADEAATFGVPSGILVNEVTVGGPAEAAGLKRDDVILEVDGARLLGVEELVHKVVALGIGGELKVTVLRGKERLPMSWKLQAFSEFSKMTGVKAPTVRADGWVGGEAPAMAKLAGSVVAVVIWQGAGAPEAEPLEKMFVSWHEAYGAKGLIVVPVHIIIAGGQGRIPPAADVVKVLEGKKFPMPVGHASGERFFLGGQHVAGPLIVADYRLQMVPAVILVDKQGRVAARWEGDTVGTGDEPKKKIEELLAK